MKQHYAITIRGRVQGVGYRYFAQKKALEHQLTGFVKNVREREVRVVAEGDTADLDTFLDHLRRGPDMARVLEVLTEKSEYTGGYTDFVIRY